MIDPYYKEEVLMLIANKSALLLTDQAIKLFVKIESYDAFEDWCYDSGGIYELPSRGSKFANKFGVNINDIHRMHRFDIPYQMKRFSDWLLRFQVPILALIAKQILVVQSLATEFKYRNVDLNEDLEL